MDFNIKHLLYIPNILSLFRLLLSIPIFLLLKNTGSEANLALLIIIAIAIATDYFDGFLSRKMNQVSDLGIILDPLADKITMGAGLIALTVYRAFPFTLVMLLIYRDLLILIGSIIISKNRKKPIMANFWGKLNTTAFSFAAFFYLLNSVYYITIPLMTFCFITIIISGISYYRIAERHFNLNRVNKYLLRSVLIILTYFVAYASTKQNSRYLSTKANIRSFEGNMMKIIEKYAPIIYFSKDETYYPIDVHSFIENTKLMKSRHFLLFDKYICDDKDKDLKKYNSDKYYMKMKRSIFSSIEKYYNNLKDIYDRKVYAVVFETNNNDEVKYIIQYWFFFFGSKAGSTWLDWHECDWEMIMFCLDHNMHPIKAGYSQHYYGEVREWSQLEIEENHPVVYIASGSHSMYFNEGKHKAYYDNKKRWHLGFDKCDKHIRWSSTDYELELINDEVAWISFKGYWGIPITIKLPGPKYRNPLDLKYSMWQNPLEWISRYED